MRDRSLSFAVFLAAFAVGATATVVGAVGGNASALAADPPKDAGVDATTKQAPISHIPPDPPPMRERAQWIFDLRWSKGEVYLVGVHLLENPSPQETPRAMGRFALELLEGPTVIERVRFDFPLLGDEPRDGGTRPIPYFGKNLVTRIGVMFPATSKGTKLQLWDRATDKRWDLPWPPLETADAGAPPVGGRP